MIVNKWIQLALSVALGLLGVAAGFDWSSVVSAATAGKIVAVLAFVKGITNLLAPAPGATATATDGTVVTHTTS